MATRPHDVAVPSPSSSAQAGRSPSSLTPLRGMLHKKHRHQHVLRNWGKRFFEVDDERGILYYFRTRAAQQWDEPARHFLLSSLVSVQAVDDAHAAPHGIELTFVTPPPATADCDAAGLARSPSIRVAL